MSDIPNSAPITIMLAPEVAAALMTVTSAYSSVLSFERRLDYCIAELAQWQSLIAPFNNGEDCIAVAVQASEAFHNVRLLVANSIQEGLSD